MMIYSHVSVTEVFNPYHGKQTKGCHIYLEFLITELILPVTVKIEH